MVGMDQHDGAVRVLVGGRDYYESSYNRATEVSRAPPPAPGCPPALHVMTGTAPTGLLWRSPGVALMGLHTPARPDPLLVWMQAERPPGSTFKPVVYLTALAEG
jgi:cell division protein FtsI/penicillin-binding protein 2